MAMTATTHGGSLADIFLMPGEYFVGTGQHKVHTVLGSCVSITLWHPALRVGAMSHFLLPCRAPDSARALDGHYGEEVMCLMMRELARRQVAVAECDAKLFGGAEMFGAHLGGQPVGVGRKNGEAARALLACHGIAIRSESLFGAGHRRLIFDLSNGDVWLRQSTPPPAAVAPGQRPAPAGSRLAAG